MDKAIQIATEGAAICLAYFGVKLYFTQSLIFGIFVTKAYKKSIICTTSQYGKSFTVARAGEYMAYKGEPVYAIGGTTDTTKIIMERARDALQTANYEILETLLEPRDKIQRMQTQLSKSRIAFIGDGFLEAISAGETFSDPRKGNKGVGRGGNNIIDEASELSDDRRAEFGRSEFANKGDEDYITMEISNPHNAGRWWEELIREDVADNKCVIWMDARTAHEEGNIGSLEKVVESEFFNNKSTCKRYLLCELEDYSESSMFNKPKIDDSEIDQYDRRYKFYIGVDSAYKGADSINVCLGCLDTNTGKIRALDMQQIHKGEWIDGYTGQKIVKDIYYIINKFNCAGTCIDIGYGVYIVEGLAGMQSGYKINGVNFSESPTKWRKDKRIYSAKFAANKRAELHLDLQMLIDNDIITMTQDVYNLVIQQMNATKAIRKNASKIGIQPKDEIKKIIGKSPDELDSLLLFIHAIMISAENEDTYIYQ